MTTDIRAGLYDFLEQYSPLSDPDREQILMHTTIEQYEAKRFFVESGKRCDEVGFIVNGVFRYYFMDNNAQEITSHFMESGNFVGNIVSFFEYSLSAGTIQAVTDCEVIVFSRAGWEHCQQHIAGWDITIQRIINDLLMKKTGFQRSLINLSATDAYLKFLEFYPEAAQQVSQQHIASYLGITPYSLSRIRKSLTTA